MLFTQVFAACGEPQQRAPAGRAVPAFGRVARRCAGHRLARTASRSNLRAVGLRALPGLAWCRSVADCCAAAVSSRCSASLSLALASDISLLARAGSIFCIETMLFLPGTRLRGPNASASVPPPQMRAAAIVIDDRNAHIGHQVRSREEQPREVGIAAQRTEDDEVLVVQRGPVIHRTREQAVGVDRLCRDRGRLVLAQPARAVTASPAAPSPEGILPGRLARMAVSGSNREANSAASACGAAGPPG